MTRLELIMSDDTPTRDDILALFSEAVDRPLTDDENATVERALREDPSLQALRQGFMQGKALLRDVERPAAPADLVPRVHRALAAERRSAAAETVVDETHAAASRSRWPSFGLALAGAAAIALVVVLAPTDAPETGIGTAGIGAEETVAAHVDVSGLEATRVQAMATEAELTVVSTGAAVVVTGDARAVHRFLLTLRAAAMHAGGAVEGVVPEEGTVQLTVQVTTTP